MAIIVDAPTFLTGVDVTLGRKLQNLKPKVNDFALYEPQSPFSSHVLATEPRRARFRLEDGQCRASSTT